MRGRRVLGSQTVTPRAALGSRGTAQDHACCQVPGKACLQAVGQAGAGAEERARKDSAFRLDTLMATRYTANNCLRSVRARIPDGHCFSKRCQKLPEGAAPGMKHPL